jgi:hypothetical protein
MLFYQIVIMLAVVIVICLLAYVIKIRSHLLLAALILILASAGAGSLCLAQYVFSTHFYVQNVDVNSLKKINITDGQKKDLDSIFSGYKEVSETDSLYTSALDKSYDIQSGGADSKITVTIYSFDSDKTAAQYFNISQKFYENKNFLPTDNKRSLNKKNLSRRYITSYIKSSYPDYNEFMYLPSKIVYFSDVVVLDRDVIVSIHERSNRASSNKNTVIEGILKTLGDA